LYLGVLNITTLQEQGGYGSGRSIPYNLSSKQTARLNPSFGIDKEFFVEFTTKTSNVLTFKAVNANDISDNLTIRLASVNGVSPKNTKPLKSVSKYGWRKT